LIFGYEPALNAERLSLAVLADAPISNATPHAASRVLAEAAKMDERRAEMGRIWEDQYRNTRNLQAIRKPVGAPQLQVGDLAYVPCKLPGKFSPSWEGPFPILTRVGKLVSFAKYPNRLFSLAHLKRSPEHEEEGEEEENVAEIDAAAEVDTIVAPSVPRSSFGRALRPSLKKQLGRNTKATQRAARG
jgi:hypothetical protein